MTETTVYTTAPRQVRRWLRRISWVIGSLLILCVVAYFVATSSAFFKGVILPKVGKAMNSDVTVSGASISPFKSVILQDFKLQPKGKDALFTAKEIRLRYSLMAMIGGSIDVHEVYVGSPLVSLVYASDGTSNLDPIMKSLEETPPAEAKPGGAECAGPAAPCRRSALAYHRPLRDPALFSNHDPPPWLGVEEGPGSEDRLLHVALVF